VYLVNPSTSANYGVISESTLDFSGLTTASLSTSGTIDVTSSSSITLTAGSGISMGDSYVYGFEKGTGTVDSFSEVYIDAMAGSITSYSTALASGSHETIAMINSRITTSSLVMVTTGYSNNCQPIVYQSIPDDGWVEIRVTNKGPDPCSTAYTLNFIVIN
jgi:hypothetical protein